MASVAVIMADPKLSQERLQCESLALREGIDSTSICDEIVGTSAALQKVLSLVSKVAPTDASVLITGETVTGKELVARAIHRPVSPFLRRICECQVRCHPARFGRLRIWSRTCLFV